MSRQYHTRIITNIIYSIIISCLVEIFLVTNVSTIARYMEELGRMNGLIQAVPNYYVAVVLVYVIFGLALFAVTLMILQEPYIRYISKTSDAAQSISEGNLNTIIGMIGGDEFSSMVTNLNKMAEDIKGLMDKERESERAKNELITNVAHDLKTPPASIIGYLEPLAGNTRIPADVQHRYIEIVHGKARRLEKLIEDLFGFTKLNYGKIPMYAAQLDVVKLLGQLLGEAYPSFVEKNFSYNLQSNVPAKTTTADGNLLARLLDNLIGNATKYGADGKRVLVKLYTDDELVTVFVINYDYVIPPDELPLIFNKSYRAEQSRSSTTGDTGLGLAIAKEITGMHGGTIQAASGPNGTAPTVKLQVYLDINKENFRTIN